jgi:hypothetical protein
MAGTPWYISSARDAVEMGNRCIAAKLNAILARNASSLAINADPPRLNDSIRFAIGQLRRAMVGLRTLREMPERDSSIFPWTLGYVNDTTNPLFNIALGADWGLYDPSTFDFLETRSWSQEIWKRQIVDPVEAYAAAVRMDLEQLALIAKSREKPQDDGIENDSALPKPKKYATGWAEIASTLQQQNDEAFQKRIKQLHSRHPGPIQLRGRGKQPIAEQRKLIEWWNSLEERFGEVQARSISRTQSTAHKYSYGRDGVVIPEIKGHERRRRRSQNRNLRKPSA